MVNIENELCSSNLILNGIPESEYEEGPEQYRLIIEAIANTVNAQTRDEQLQAARRIPIKKSSRLGKYNSRRGRPIVVHFVYHEDVNIYLPTEATYLMEYTLKGNIVRKQKIKEEYYDLFTRLQKTILHTEDVVQWKESF